MDGRRSGGRITWACISERLTMCVIDGLGRMLIDFSEVKAHHS